MPTRIRIVGAAAGLAVALAAAFALTAWPMPAIPMWVWHFGLPIAAWHVAIALLVGSGFGPWAASVRTVETGRVVVAFAGAIAILTGLVVTILGYLDPGPIVDPLFDTPSAAGAAIGFVLDSMAFLLVGVVEAAAWVLTIRVYRRERPSSQPRIDDR